MALKTVPKEVVDLTLWFECEAVRDHYRRSGTPILYLGNRYIEA